MNEVINNILTRRSVRDFSDKPVKKEDIETLINVARYAPSGRNAQTWKFTAILNKNVIEDLQILMRKALNNENYKLHNSQALIIPSNDRDNNLWRDDNACALQNIFLASHSLKIDSLWINQLSMICDNSEIREFLTKLEIPENHIISGFAGLGYSLSEPKGMVDKKSNFVIIE